MGTLRAAVPSTKNILRAISPTHTEKWTLRIMVLGSFFWLIIFLWWFFGKSRIGNPYLYWPLTIALILKLMQRAYEWYHYYSISVPEKPESTRTFTVDMLTTACPGEPHSMIIRTIRKMVAVKYPHTTYLCDEGNDPVLKKACEELGVIHVTRTEKKHAKAGNINNALKQATGELCVIMDPDHEPVPEFLDRVVDYFEDPKVGYVQVVQGYYNQKEGFVARAAAEQTYHFYGPMMMCMNSYGTAQAIGANCTFRREALESIGGHAPGLTEDMHTSMKIQAKGYKVLYVPEMLSRGLVPSTVSAFYKQQIKWARGTFELFFEVLPGLLKDLTWRQRFHHLMSPVYYLSGVTNLINILIPILALFLGEFPWKVDIETFLLFYSPLVLMTLLIRQYSQKWLLEESERGFHMRGGLLQLGTWWVYLVGFIYSIFRVKVPYIPTPKEGVVENNWKIVLPNIVAAALSIVAIVYGLQTDYTPYSIFMAGFAITNFVFLTGFSLVVQQKMVVQIQRWLFGLFGSAHRSHQVALWKVRHAFYFRLREAAFTLSIIMISSLMFYHFSKKGPEKGAIHTLSQDMKKTGGFYHGVYLPIQGKTVSLSEVDKWKNRMGHQVSIVSFYQAWGPQSILEFPDSLLNIAIEEKGMTPMITWEPWSSTFPEFSQDFNLAVDRKVMAGITEGKFDNYLLQYSEKIRSLAGPVFLRFAHEPDNPQYPWSKVGANTPEEFVEAHRYVVNFFAVRGVTNVAWVYNPWNDKNAERYYPGDDFVDWIGITGLNYGLASPDGKWKSFQEIYEPFRAMLLKHKKPVMLSEFGSTAYGGDQEKWLNESLYWIGEKYKEIKSITYFYSNVDKNWTTSWRPNWSNGFIDWTFAREKKCLDVLHYHYAKAPYNQTPSTAAIPALPTPRAQQTYLSHGNQGFQLQVDGQPFFIKGIAYNTGSDWRDGNIPLTKKVLDEDFAAIKQMGANTIRRYSASIYDDNILESAKENDLKVMFGFWLDPTVDYYSDSVQAAAYFKEIEEKVARYKDDKSIVVWSVGNETWGLLKHSFVPPYLSKVRRSYTLFVEKVAQRIHQLDPSRIVITAMEHTKELPAELAEFHRYAPSIDAAGVNSYYIENIRVLDSLAIQYYPNKPYIVTEFGPKGYWNKYLSQLKNDSIIEEEGDREKAAYYVLQWNKYVKAYAGHNLGGVAYCWHDRMEGTATWYGITDYKGRKKPLYYALRETWTAKKSPQLLPRFDIQWETDTLIPGKYAAFHAKLPEQEKHLKHEWFLRKETTMEEFPGFIREFHDGKRIFMKIPNSPGLYRLYLYVYDENGNVSSISHPIPVAFYPSKKIKS